MPILTTPALVQPIADNLGKAYKDVMSTVDFTRTSPTTPSGIYAIRLIRESVFGAVGDISVDAQFDATLAFANSVRSAERSTVTQASSMIVGIAQGLESNLRSVSGKKFRDQFDGINTAATVVFSTDFAKLWMASNHELLRSQLVGYLSDGTIFTPTPSSPFPLVLADPRDGITPAPSNLEIRVRKLGAASLIKITGDTVAAPGITVSVQVLANSTVGADDVRYAVATTVPVFFTKITAITIQNPADTSAYNGASADAISVWIA